MKKIIYTIFIFFFMLCNVSIAQDIIPTSSGNEADRSLGLYQVGNDITIYEKPDTASKILYRVRWNKDDFFPQNINFDKFFMIYIENKALALVDVLDYDDDWLEIVYNRKSQKSGWIKIDDPYKFMTWNNFYNTYGKKYGLVKLQGSPETILDIKASPFDNSKTVGTINNPIKINLNVIRGNWALVSVMDLDRTPKTGYIRWRSEDGVRYYFPAMK